MEASRSTTLYNVVSVVLVLALISDFVWVISTALRTMSE